LFFFNFIFQHWVDWKLNFIICLFVFYEFIPISWVRFSRLIRVDLGYYVCTFFFNLRLQNWVDWELRFIIFLFIYFLWGYHGLMTWVMGWLIDSRCFCHFLVDFFSISFFNIGFTGIRLHNLFWFDLYEDILVFWSRSQVWLIESSGLIFFKKIILQYWVDWELIYIICFDFLCMELSPSHDICLTC